MWPSIAIEKATQMGAKVITACDSNATIVDEKGNKQCKAIISWISE
jgi:glutamate dehydrogenase/leucine dehydrogenase